MKKKPIILVTNDDGITAPGIRKLIEIMNSIGKVYVVAPNKSQSGMGHAITVNNIIQIEKIIIDNGPQKEWICTGTPVDCVKIAIDKILPKKPDICVSGINHGSNASINVLYSGTMSAAIEASIEGIKSIGFSLLDHSWNADFEQSIEYIKKITNNILKIDSNIKGISFNVNIPNIKNNKIKGIKICRQAKGQWKENFKKRKSPDGKKYYWLTGEFINTDKKNNETDIWALKKGYISIVPIQFDMTSYKTIKILK